MATFVAGSFPNVDHGGEIDQNMSDKGPLDVPQNISNATQAPMGTRDHVQAGEEAVETKTKQSETQHDSTMPDEKCGGSHTSVEISPNDNHIPRQDEPAEKSGPIENGDKNPGPPPPPLDRDTPPYYVPNAVPVPYRNNVNWFTSPGPGRNAVHGLVDYMRGVDERLQIIEKKLHTNQETIQKPRNKVAPPDETGSADPNNVRTGVKFFEAVVEDFYQTGTLQDNTTDYGRFSSNKDHPQVLRVLYNKLSDHKTIDKTNPDPAQVEIIYLSILSDPIASFFRDVLGLDCGSGYACMRFSKPFRPLIRNLKPLRDHLAKLEEAYGYRVSNFSESRDGLPSQFANKAVVRNLELDQKPGEVATGTNDAVPSAEGDVAAANDSAESIPSVADSIEGNSSDSHEQLEKSFLRPSSLPHFKTIVGFVERYLDKSAEMYENLKSGRDDKVAFENLWMLFDAGNTIYCPYGNGTEIFHTYEALSERTYSTEPSLDMTYTRARSSPQAYCVLATRGGVPLRKSLMPGGIEEDDEENDFLQSIDVLLRLEQLELFRQGESGRNRKDAAQPALGRHGLGGAPTRRTKNAMSGLIIACFSIEYDGYRYGPQRELFEIKPYDGLKDVRSMEIFPVQYLGDAEMGRLLQRGRKFIDLANNAHMSYEGTTAGNARETVCQKARTPRHLWAMKRFFRGHSNQLTVDFWCRLIPMLSWTSKSRLNGIPTFPTFPKSNPSFRKRSKTIGQYLPVEDSWKFMIGMSMMQLKAKSLTTTVGATECFVRSQRITPIRTHKAKRFYESSGYYSTAMRHQARRQGGPGKSSNYILRKTTSWDFSPESFPDTPCETANGVRQNQQRYTPPPGYFLFEAGLTCSFL